MADVLGTKDSPPQPGSSVEKMEQMHQQEYFSQDDNPIDIEAKKKEDALRRKLDRFVAPVMMMLMLISYLDRGNIGFAATQGMTKDIGLKGSELNVSLTQWDLGTTLLTINRLPCLCSTSSTFSRK